ncbi:MAG: hypothetical protein R3E66_00295 [bacterium]
MKPNLLFVCLSTILAAGCLADLRSNNLVVDGISAVDRDQGRAILERSAKAHGLQRWRQHQTVTVTYTDTWYRPVERLVSMPYPQNGQRLVHDQIVGSDSSRWMFKGGPLDGTVWGIQNWATYRLQDATPTFEPDNTLKFWLPTNAYFFQAPFRLREATVVAHAGTARVDGRLLDIVFLSWNTAAPQSDVDQYVAYIDRESGQLMYLQYTIRDIFRTLIGTMHYTDYREIDGMLVPHRMTVVTEPGGPRSLHEYLVESVGFDQVPKASLLPDPKRRGTK